MKLFAARGNRRSATQPIRCPERQTRLLSPDGRDPDLRAGIGAVFQQFRSVNAKLDALEQRPAQRILEPPNSDQIAALNSRPLFTGMSSLSVLRELLQFIGQWDAPEQHQSLTKALAKNHGILAEPAQPTVVCPASVYRSADRPGRTVS